tara:strand:- start:306 stop:848 length:543 start_codon:yes stop_codon:yes gene_type:complete
MAKLKVEIRETITLQNNNKYDAYNRYTLNGINHVDKRIVRVPTTGTEILVLSSSIGAGTFNKDNVRYIRCTNLSAFNPVMLEFKNENDDTFVTKVGQGLSFIYSGDHNNVFPVASSSGLDRSMDATTGSFGVIDIDSANYAGLGDLVNIIAKTSGSSAEYTGSPTGSVYNVDMEIFVAAI